MRNYLAQLRTFLEKKWFVLCMVLVAVLAYGFAIATMSINIDTLENEQYLGSGQAMLAAGRFTFPILGTVFRYIGAVPQNAYILELFSAMGLMLTAINFCILFKRICADALTDAACLVFSCIFISYPLHQELWEYHSAMLCVCLGFLCVSYALLCMQQVLHRKEKGNWKTVSLAALLLMLACAGYESLIPVYIFGVFALLALQAVYGSPEEKQLKEILRQGICYAAVLVAGFALRLLVHQGILHLWDIVPKTNGDTSILWGTMPAKEVLKGLLIDWYRKYILRGIIYFPLTEVLVAACIVPVIGLFACRKHGWTLLLPGAGLYLSLIILALVQGSISPYRTCQVFSVFVAFAAMLVVMAAGKWKHAKRRVLLLVLCGYLCFSQASFMNYFLTLNHIRSEEEAFVVRDIGRDLKKEADPEKPVLFVGTYEVSESIIAARDIPYDSLRWKIYEEVFLRSQAIDPEIFAPDRLYGTLPQTNVLSLIEWCTYAFEQESMQHLFAYYGHTYVLADYGLYAEAESYVQENQIPAYPMEGYIHDMGDYIIVHIQ